MATATDTFLAEALARRQKAIEALQPQKPKIKDLVTEEPIEMKKSVLDAGQRAESAGLVTNEQKKKHLEAVGYKPELIGELNGKVGVYNPEDTRQFFPIDPQGFEAGDVTELWRKGLVTGSQMLGAGTAGALGLPSGPGAIATAAVGAGIAGGATEAAAQKFTIEQLKKKYPGYDFGKVSGGEVALEALAGAGGEVLGAGLGLASKGLKKPSGKVVEKIGEKIAGKNANKTIKVTKALAGNLQDSTFEHVGSNPYISKNFWKVGAQQTDTLADNAAKNITRLKNSVPGLQSRVYKSLGIDDIKTKVPVGNAMFNIQNKLSNFTKNAITDAEEKAVKQVSKDYEKLLNRVGKAGKVSFGDIKKITKSIYEAAESATTKGDYATANIYKSVGSELTNAKNSIPAIKNASSKYKEALKIDDIINKLFKLDTRQGELSIERKILSRYKDAGNQTFKQELDALENIIKTNPEFKAFKNVVNKVKLAQVAQDVTQAKAIKPADMSRFLPGAIAKNLPSIDPMTRMQSLAGAAQKGIVKPENVLTSVPYSDIPLIGGGINKFRANMALYGTKSLPLGIGKIAEKTGKAIKTSIPALKPTMTRELLKPAFQNNQISIQDLIKQKREQANVTA